MRSLATPDFASNLLKNCSARAYSSALPENAISSGYENEIKCRLVNTLLLNVTTHLV